MLHKENSLPPPCAINVSITIKWSSWWMDLKNGYYAWTRNKVFRAWDCSTTHPLITSVSLWKSSTDEYTYNTERCIQIVFRHTGAANKLITPCPWNHTLYPCCCYSTEKGGCVIRERVWGNLELNQASDGWDVCQNVNVKEKTIPGSRPPAKDNNLLPPFSCIYHFPFVKDSVKIPIKCNQEKQNKGRQTSHYHFTTTETEDPLLVRSFTFLSVSHKENK